MRIRRRRCNAVADHSAASSAYSSGRRQRTAQVELRSTPSHPLQGAPTEVCSLKLNRHCTEKAAAASIVTRGATNIASAKFTIIAGSFVGTGATACGVATGGDPRSLLLLNC